MRPNEIKLLDLLKNKDVTFFIPPYQRNYEWTDEQCSVFLNDIVKTTEQNESGEHAEHFFGTITYFATETQFGQPDKLILIDGQQRITTTMLFLVAFRDIVGAESNEGIYIESKYLKNDNVLDENEYKIKLKQVETDWETYKLIVLGESLENVDKNSYIYRNYKFFYNKLADYQREENNVSKFIQDGLAKFDVVTIELEPFKNVTIHTPYRGLETPNMANLRGNSPK